MIGFATNFFRSARTHAQYWEHRKIDWQKDYMSTWNHPHRFVISTVLKTFDWYSLLEVGVGGGANLANIIVSHNVANGNPKQLGGIDINPDAIEHCNKAFQGAFFKVCPMTDLMMSDDSVDVILTDMALFYAGRDIHKVIKEMYRVARNRVVLCEFHSESLWERLKIKFTSGYNAYDYVKLLEKHGFYDVIRYKIPPETWPGGLQEKVGYIIVAKVPRRK